MKQVARYEDEAIVSIPEVLGIVIVAVQPEVVVIAFHVEHVEIAVRVGFA